MDVLKHKSLAEFFSSISLPSTESEKLDVSEWSKKLGYRSPRTLGMVLSGSRLPSADMLIRLGKKLNLSSLEAQYLTLLAQKERLTRKKLPTDEVDLDLARFQPRNEPVRVLNRMEAESIVKWYVYPIKQLLETPNVVPTPQWIQKRLKGTVSITQIEETLNALEKVGVIKRSNCSTVTEVIPLRLDTQADIPNQVIRRYHRDIAKLAESALYNDPVQKREFLNLTLRFDPKKMQQAKRSIRAYKDQFLKEFGENHATEVFQLSIQFFSHTKWESKYEN